MPIYSYTLKKYVKHKSTWVIILVAFLLVYVVLGVVGFKNNIDYARITREDYLNFTLILYAGIAVFYAFLGAIFAAFTGAKVFKDEVEDGTFLIVLSKPISRGRIVLEKWLAFATMQVLFVFIVAFSLIMAALSFDHGNSTNPNWVQLRGILVSNNLNKVFWMAFGIGLVICFIFSSLALIFSTYLSVGATIGLTAAIALMVPITAFLGRFTEKSTHLNNFATFESARIHYDENQEVWFINGFRITNAMIQQPFPTFTIPGSNVTFTIRNTRDLADMYQAMVFYLALFGFDNQNSGIVNLGIRETSTSTYSYLSYLDLSYQFGQLGSIISSSIVSQGDIADSFGVRQFFNPRIVRTNVTKQVVVDHYNATTIQQGLGNMNTSINLFGLALMNLVLNSNVPPGLQPSNLISLGTFVDYNVLIENANSVLNDIQKQTLAEQLRGLPTTATTTERVQVALTYLAEQGKLDQIEYEDFLNKYWVLGVYVFISVGLVPLSYVILKKQDFR